MIIKIRISLVIAIIISLVLIQPIGVRAIGPTGPVGPQGTVGPNPEKVGLQSPVGPQGAVGPQKPVGPDPDQLGPQGPVGPQGTVGPKSSLQGHAQLASPQTTGDHGPSASSSSSASPDPQSGTTQSSTSNDAGASNSGAQSQSNGSALPAVASQSNTSGGFPSSTSAANETTGESSNNQNAINQDSSTAIGSTSKTDITNNINGTINTGRNETVGNTKSGGVTTGSIIGAANILNLANSQIVAKEGTLTQQKVGDSSSNIILGDPATANTVPLSAIILHDLAGQAAVNNKVTGASSNNENVVRQVGDTTIRVSNDAKIDNNVDLKANTGGNQANLNTGIGSIVTGAVKLSVNIINFLNTFIATDYLGIAFIDVLGVLSGDIVVPSSAVNNSTGVDSTNANTVTQSGSLTLTKESDANVNNNVSVDAQTGQNKANGNTLGASISTGKTDVDIQSATITGEIPSDSLLLVVVNEIGEGQWTGQVMGNPSNVVVLVQKSMPANQVQTSNIETGPNSNNSNTVDQASNTNISEINQSLVNNNVSVEATTGNNEASFNTSGGSIKTGDVNIAANMINFVNASGKSFKKVVLAVINVFGKWTGNLVFGSKDPVTIPSPQAATTTPSPTQGVAVASTPAPSSVPGVATTTTIASTQAIPSSSTPVAPTLQPSPVTSTSSITTDASTAYLTTSSSASPTSSREAKQQTVQRVSASKKSSSMLVKAADEFSSNPQAQELSTNFEDGQQTETQGARYPIWAYALITVAVIAAGTLFAYSRKPTE